VIYLDFELLGVFHHDLVYDGAISLLHHMQASPAIFLNISGRGPLHRAPALEPLTNDEVHRPPRARVMVIAAPGV